MVALEAEFTAPDVGNKVSRDSVRDEKEGKIDEDAPFMGKTVLHEEIMADDAWYEALSDVGNVVLCRYRRHRRRQHRKSGLQSQTGFAQSDLEPKAKALRTQLSNGYYHVL